MALGGTADAGGRTSRVLPVPADPSLGDRELYLQWAVASPANRLGLVTTDGGVLAMR